MKTFDFSDPPLISRSVDLGIYTRKALADTQMAYKSYCRVQTQALPKNRLLISLIPNESESANFYKLLLEFWNYFLDKSCQEKLCQH